MDEQPGKHRLDDGVAQQPRPVGGGDRIPLQRGRQPDPLQDTDGLRKFNIGLVPASVTPPRTWKRAAWFAVVSSVLVLVALSVAAAKLVGGGGEVETVGLPGYPSDVPLISALPTGRTSPSATGARPSAAGTGTGAPVPGASSPGEASPGSASPGASRSTGQGSATSARPPATAPPVITTLPVTQAPAVDGAAIAQKTEHFYREMATNADTALALTTDTVRSNADTLLEGRLGDISAIEVKEIVVDPGRGLTVSVLRVTTKDGAVNTEKRELSFTLGDLPLINGERLKTDR
ncbi:hypothetical protein SAMN05216188_101870 [Lentzea xinjiangensis]|uniref:Uncharacterized protein n=1 Tax=Lentzea xinjiangensis TaxID=402600 RepID=A0A1H9BQB4_9PSEU|nr:hypothetical protein [Lentzea xinjiangensis]SEP90723.1 hypothetical protein SAMN05216188_101870 [Lentzea xinjiangensis]